MDIAARNVRSRSSASKIGASELRTLRAQKKILTQIQIDLDLHQKLLAESLRLLEEESVDDIFFIGKIYLETNSLLGKIKKLTKEDDVEEIPF